MDLIVDPGLAAEFEPIRDGDERLLWAGKPHYVPYVAKAAPMLFFGMLWGCFDLFFLVAAMKGKVHGATGFLLPFLTLHSFPAWGSLLYVLYLAFSYKNAAYAITNRRVMLRGGLWAPNYRSIDMDQIGEVDVTIGPIENMIGCGTIRANCGRTTSKGTAVTDDIVGVDKPYDVYKLLKQTAVDIKTDWNYPNKLRPSENPGYHTEYKPGS